MHAPVCTILVVDPLLLRHLSQVGIPIRAQRQCALQTTIRLHGNRFSHFRVNATSKHFEIKRFSTCKRGYRVVLFNYERILSGCNLCAQWWLACVLEKDLENAEVRLTLLHPHGPGRSYKNIPQHQISSHCFSQAKLKTVS